MQYCQIRSICNKKPESIKEENKCRIKIKKYDIKYLLIIIRIYECFKKCSLSEQTVVPRFSVIFSFFLPLLLNISTKWEKAELICGSIM